MTSKIVYLGDLRTAATHIQSTTEIETDAPVDNQGKGERFSPTDLVATALGACMMTIMGIKARDKNIDLKGTTIDIVKIMGTEPRRIVEIQVKLQLPAHLADLSEKDKKILENAALACPVAKSLHPELLQTVHFYWQ